MKTKKPIKKQLPIEGDKFIVLLDMLGSEHEVTAKEMECNIYCIDKNGSQVWQINNVTPIYARSPFTNIYFDGFGNLFAYNWDGTNYSVNVDTGYAKPVALIK